MKYLKIVVINLIFLTVLYQMLEFTCFFLEVKRSYPLCAGNRSFKQFLTDNITGCYLLKYKSFDKNYKDLQFRKVEGSEFSDKKPIVIFGCSFAYGASLGDNQTVSYKLSKYLSRKVYNRAISGWGPQDMLYQVQRPDFYDTVKEEPEAVIYIFMCGHSYRIYREVWSLETQTFYKLSNNKLVQSFFHAGQPFYGFLARKIRYFWAENIWNDSSRQNEINNFAIAHFLTAKNEMEKHWKNTKYYILDYSNSYNESQLLNELNNKGYSVIYADSLTNENLHQLKYHISESDEHPNEKAWNLLTPLIANELHLN